MASIKNHMRQLVFILVLCLSFGILEPLAMQAEAASSSGASYTYTWVKQKSTKKTKKKTSKKTIKLKKAASKTYSQTKTKKSSKSSSKVKGSTKTVTKVDTVVKTTTKYKKKSKKAYATIVKTTTTTTTPYKKKKVASGTSSSSISSVSEPKKDKEYESSYILQLAPKADVRILNAFQQMGFRILYRPTSSYSGYFNAGTRSVSLKSMDRTTIDHVIYHELGHFFAWIAGNVDQSDEFKAIYAEEKGNYTKPNKAYVTSTSAEFFAECYSWYVRDYSWLQKQCPKACLYISQNLNNISQERIAYLLKIYGAYWKSIGY